MSLGRLQNLLKKSQNTFDLLDTYDNIIQSQLGESIIQDVVSSAHPTTVNFYLSQKPVIRENAEGTKVRIVYDALAMADDQSKLELGPDPQNLIWYRV